MGCQALDGTSGRDKAGRETPYAEVWIEIKQAAPTAFLKTSFFLQRGAAFIYDAHHACFMRTKPTITLRAAVLAALAIGVQKPVWAADTPSLTLEPAPAGDRGVLIERAGVRGHFLFSSRFLVDYAYRPLVLKNDRQYLDAVVQHQTWFHALAAFALGHRIAAFADVPVAAMQAGDDPPGSPTAPLPDSAVFGDLKLGARVRLYASSADNSADEGVMLGFASSLWLPTASGSYGGDGAVRGRVALLAEGLHKHLYWAANLGFRSRPAQTLPGLVPSRLGSAVCAGLGAGFFADDAHQLSLGMEWAVDFTVGGGARFLDPRATVAHWLLNGHYRLWGGPFEVGAAFGPGLGQGAGAADFRLITTLGYAPETPVPLPDRDGDGTPDKADACADLPGTPNDDPLLNGCPEAPLDRDGDAIPDDNDACPTLVGEPTFVRTTHGCPKRAIDTDGDGWADGKDACPKEAGPTYPEGNGCPKPVEPPPPPKAQLSEKQIEIDQKVQFEVGTATLLPESDAILTEVARVLAEHPEVLLIEVQGHTDNTGPAELNRKLGQARAESVVQWLIAHGVAKERLSAHGYGPDFPVAGNDTDEGKEKNRRVEFQIIKKQAPVNSPESKPLDNKEEAR